VFHTSIFFCVIHLQQVLVIVMGVDYCYCPTGYFIRLASGLFGHLGQFLQFCLNNVTCMSISKDKPAVMSNIGSLLSTLVTIATKDNEYCL